MQTESVNNSVVYEPIAGLYRLRFDDDVAHPSYYRFEIEALQRATENDKVSITINTDGGSLATGIEFTNEILQCKAPVHGTLRANCHSCGSIVFLACDSHEVGIASEMLLHSGGGGTGGTPAQSVKRAESYKRQVRALFETVYKGFVTDEELDLMIEHDKEYIFSADEIKERLEIMYSYRQQQQESSLEDLFSSQNEEAEKMEQVLLNKLLEDGKLTQEEVSVAKRVQKATLELDESLDDEQFNKLMEEGVTSGSAPPESLDAEPEDKSLCKFEVSQEDLMIKRNTVLGEVYEVSKNGYKYQCADNLADYVIEQTFLSKWDLQDLKEHCDDFGIKYAKNIKNKDILIKKIIADAENFWKEYAS